MNELEVKKELFKSKEVAKLSHYVSGNLYYTVKLEGGVYQFPISTIDKVDLNKVVSTGVYTRDHNMYHSEFINDLYTKVGEDSRNYEKIKFDKLSSDLGTTTFSAEMRGSELNRWIAKAIKSGEFIKVSE
jgi:hypothetical protein